MRRSIGKTVGGRCEAAVARRHHVRTDSSKVIQSGVTRTTAGRGISKDVQSGTAVARQTRTSGSPISGKGWSSAIQI